MLSRQPNEHLIRLKVGDKQSFQIVYDYYVEALHAFVFRFVKSRSLADDVIQELFIKVWENRATIDHSKSFQAYLYKIAKNLVLNILSRYKLEEHIMTEMLAGAISASNKTEEEVYYRETEILIQQGVDKLPPQQRKIFELCKTHGLTYEQVAQQMDLSASTINSQMVTLLRFLKQHLTTQESGKSANTLSQ